MARLVTQKEYKKRRLKLQIAAGFWDFAVIIVFFLISVLCLYLLLELLMWIKDDIPQSFQKFITIAERALHINGM